MDICMVILQKMINCYGNASFKELRQIVTTSKTTLCILQINKNIPTCKQIVKSVNDL